MTSAMQAVLSAGDMLNMTRDTFDERLTNRINWVRHITTPVSTGNKSKNVMQFKRSAVERGYELQLLNAAYNIVNSSTKAVSEFQEVMKEIREDLGIAPKHKTLKDTPAGDRNIFGKGHIEPNREKRRKVRYIADELNEVIRQLSSKDRFISGIYLGIDLGINGNPISKDELFKKLRSTTKKYKKLSYKPTKGAPRGKQGATFQDFDYNIGDVRVNNLFVALNKQRKKGRYKKSYDVLKDMDSQDILDIWADDDDDIFDIVFDYDEELDSGNDNMLYEFIVNHIKYKGKEVKESVWAN